MRKLKAKLGKIPPNAFFSQHEMDAAKVDALVAHLQSGGTVPPVVVARYGSEHMLIDGHHRLMAAQRLGLTLDAWIVDGEKFETLDQQCQIAGTGARSEDHVTCGGVPALHVAHKTAIRD